MFVPFGIQHALCMQYIILPSVASPTLQFFYVFSLTAPFPKNTIEHKTCVLILSTILSETFLILRRNERDMIKMFICFHVNYPLFLSDINNTWIFRQIFWRPPNIKFHENPSSESRVIPCGRTDMTQLTVVFRNFAYEPKNWTLSVWN